MYQGAPVFEVEAGLQRTECDLTMPIVLNGNLGRPAQIKMVSVPKIGLDLEYSRSLVFFTWVGYDEMDEVNGSGAAELLDDGTLEIEFAYHLGNEAMLKAKRDTSSTTC